MIVLELTLRYKKNVNLPEYSSSVLHFSKINVKTSTGCRLRGDDNWKNRRQVIKYRKNYHYLKVYESSSNISPVNCIRKWKI